MKRHLEPRDGLVVLVALDVHDFEADQIATVRRGREFIRQFEQLAQRGAQSAAATALFAVPITVVTGISPAAASVSRPSGLTGATCCVCTEQLSCAVGALPSARFGNP